MVCEAALGPAISQVMGHIFDPVRKIYYPVSEPQSSILMSFAEDHALLGNICVGCGTPKTFSSFKRKRCVYVYAGLILCTYGTHGSHGCACRSGCCVCETFLCAKNSMSHGLELSFLCMSTNTKSQECDGCMFLLAHVCVSICVDVQLRTCTGNPT